MLFGLDRFAINNYTTLFKFEPVLHSLQGIECSTVGITTTDLKMTALMDNSLSSVSKNFSL